jgi:hypothetical protein
MTETTLCLITSPRKWLEMGESRINELPVPSRKVLLEKLIVAQLVNKLLAFLEPE